MAHKIGDKIKELNRRFLTDPFNNRDAVLLEIVMHGFKGGDSFLELWKLVSSGGLAQAGLSPCGVA